MSSRATTLLMMSRTPMSSRFIEGSPDASGRRGDARRTEAVPPSPRFATGAAPPASRRGLTPAVQQIRDRVADGAGDQQRHQRLLLDTPCQLACGTLALSIGLAGDVASLRTGSLGDVPGGLTGLLGGLCGALRHVLRLLAGRVDAVSSLLCELARVVGRIGRHLSPSW